MWYREAQEGIEDTSTITEVSTHPVALALMCDHDIRFVSSQGKEERERKERKEKETKFAAVFGYRQCYQDHDKLMLILLRKNKLLNCER